MNCKCIQLANDALQGCDTEIDVTFIMPTMRETLRIPTKWREGIKPKRGKRPQVLLATFCPMCGKKANTK